jgi:dihydrofolate reductase
MGRLIYLMNVSLDGFVATLDGSLDWGVVDDELHTWFNEQAQRADAFLYGRRMYELMAAYWPTATSDPAASTAMLEFAHIWVAKPKVVFSTTSRAVDWNGRLASGDVAERLAELRSEFPGDLEVSGPTLASAFIARGLVDEFQLVVHPVVLGSGTSFFPNLEARIGLKLLETRVFESGVTYLSYGTDRDR